MDADLCFASATELSQLIRTKQVGIVELVELFYQRISDLNPKLNAYLTLCEEQALACLRWVQGWSRCP